MFRERARSCRSSRTADRRSVQREKGLELQASRPLPSRWNLLYGYRFKTSSVSSDLDEFSTTTRIASLDVSLLRDTRDNPLNARRGRFWSLNLEIAPRLLASDLDFAKGMAQLFASRSFGPSLTWAQGYRLGLAHVFSGERLVFSERFRAGGGNSIRGFATDSLGPRDFLGERRRRRGRDRRQPGAALHAAGGAGGCRVLGRRQRLREGQRPRASTCATPSAPACAGTRRWGCCGWTSASP